MDFEKKNVDNQFDNNNNKTNFSGENLTNTKKSEQTAFNQDINNENILSTVAYSLGFISGIIILLVEPKNNKVRFHAMQSIIFFAIVTAIFIAFSIISIIINFIPFLGYLFTTLIFAVLNITTLILWIVCMIKAFQGQIFRIPIIADIADKQLNKQQR